MSNNSQQKVPASDFIGSAQATAVESEFDMSVTDVPQDWVTAEEASPTGNDDRPLSPPSRLTTIPTGQEGTFISNIGALGAALVGGAAWFGLDALDLYRGPWVAIGVGLLIGVAVRMGGGGESGYRAVLAAATYLLTLFVTLVAMTHRQLTEIYGSGLDLQGYEQNLIETKFQDPLYLVAYAVGLGVAARVAAMNTRNR